MDIAVKDGWIEVITGGMYAGKTEELLRRVRRVKYAKKEILVFKPALDTRYGLNEIVSHKDVYKRQTAAVIRAPLLSAPKRFLCIPITRIAAPAFCSETGPGP